MKKYRIPFALSLLVACLANPVLAASEINSLDNRIYRCDQVFNGGKNISAMLILGNSTVAKGDDITVQDGMPDVVGVSPINGLCYPAKDPLMGTVGEVGSPWPRLANKLIESRRYEGILLIPILSPKSSIADWKQDGKIFNRLKLVTASLMKEGISISSVIWQHEEANDSTAQTSDYVIGFNELTQGLRSIGIQAPVYVAQMGACAGRTDNPFHAAQKTLASEKDNVLNGPDLMSLQESDFVAGSCLLNKQGLDAYVSSWAEILKK